MNLAQAKKNKYYYVQGISQSSPFKIRRRLLELGFTEGVKVKLTRKSLIGQAYLIEIRGFILSMRKQVASFILLKGEER